MISPSHAFTPTAGEQCLVLVSAILIGSFFTLMLMPFDGPDSESMTVVSDPNPTILSDVIERGRRIDIDGPTTDKLNRVFEVRIAAMRFLNQMPHLMIVSCWVPDPRQTAALRALDEVRRVGAEGEVVQSLMEMLDDKKSQAAAVNALGHFGEHARPAVSALLRVLKHGDETVRVLTADTLGRLGFDDEGIARALIQALKDDDQTVAMHAAMALGDLPPRDFVLPQLIEALDHTDSHVRWQAAEAVATYGEKGKAALPRLKAIRARQRGLDADAAAEAIEKIAGKTRNE